MTFFLLFIAVLAFVAGVLVGARNKTKADQALQKAHDELDALKAFMAKK